MTARKCLVAVDESTTIKNPSAKDKAITQMASMARYRRILTGSPVTRSPLDLYSQCIF